MRKRMEVTRKRYRYGESTDYLACNCPGIYRFLLRDDTSLYGGFSGISRDFGNGWLWRVPLPEGYCHFVAGDSHTYENFPKILVGDDGKGSRHTRGI